MSFSISGLLVLLRVAVTVIGALIRASLRRMLRGPLVPGWTWDVELWRAGFAAALGAGSRIGTPGQWAKAMLPAPLRGRLRRQVRVTPGSLGGIGGEWVTPTDRSDDGPSILYLHGGGYVIGSAASERPLIAAISVAAEAEAFGADYRLAPRHPFPAAVDDAHAAYRGLVEMGRDPARIILVGDSAGGGLAIALLVRLRDEGAPLPAGAIVLSPWVDLTNSAKSISTNSGTDYLGEITADGSPLYLDGEDPTHPLASPIFADLAGLPPLLIFAGGREMLLDDAVGLHEKALGSGVPSVLHIEPDMFHVWPVMLPRHPASERVFAIAGDWTRSLHPFVGGHR